MPRPSVVTVLACLLSVLGGIAAAFTGLVVPAIIIGAVAVAVAARNATLLAPLLVVAAIPFLRPNLFGERFSALGAALVLLAALLCTLAERGRLSLFARARRPLRSVPTWLFIAYLLLLLREAIAIGDTPLRPLFQSLVLTVGVVLALAIVLSDPQRCRIVARGFIALVLLLCASYAVTAAVWVVAGVGALQVGAIEIAPRGLQSVGQPVFFPFTTTAGTQTSGGLTVPRLTGLGREPGWMAMYAAFAYFLLPYSGTKGHWWQRPLLLLGLVGTISTAGFGVFVVVWALARFLVKRDEPMAIGYLRQLTGLGVLAGALWLAVAAPVLGLAAKAELNQVSLDERTQATQAGLVAIKDVALFGGEAADVVAGVNLIASAAASGLLFVLAVCAALWLPRLAHPDRSRTTAMVSVLFLTLLTSQPPGDSTWVFGLCLLAYAVTLSADRRDDQPEQQRDLSLPSRAGR